MHFETTFVCKTSAIIAFILIVFYEINNNLLHLGVFNEYQEFQIRKKKQSTEKHAPDYYFFLYFLQPWFCQATYIFERICVLYVRLCCHILYVIPDDIYKLNWYQVYFKKTSTNLY